jgi:pimeloyl-ACP methyl ester carboxylesterase
MKTLFSISTIVKRIASGLLALSALLCAAALAAEEKSDMLITRDHFIPHVSTVPANAGQLVGIHVREKIQPRASGQAAGRVVLFVHGVSIPSVPDFDLDYKTYNWMAYLARAGFRVYAMDHTGYGGSPRPMMDDPSNVNPQQQAIITPRPLKGATAPNYPFQFNTIRDDWGEIDAVVDWLRKLHRVGRVSLVGWSAGGPRVGGYVAQHAGKVDRVILYAPGPTVEGLQIPEHTDAGFPMNLQTREDLEKKRWDPDVRCPGQLEPGIRDVVWKAIMQWDRVGASWGPEGGVMRVRAATRFGWTRELAGKVRAPTLVMAGEYDRLEERRSVYEQLGSKDKVFMNVACGSHFMLWEKQHTALHIASKEWLTHGRLKNVRRGEIRVDPDGAFIVGAEAIRAK